MADGVNSDFSSTLNQNPISGVADSTGLHPDTAETALRRDDWSGKHPMLPILRSIAAQRRLALPGDARILDFGCGLGRHVRELRAAGYDAIGVDLDQPQFIKERSRLPDGGSYLFATSPAGEFPFEDGSFDLCFSTSTLEHVMSYEKPMSEIARISKARCAFFAFLSGWLAPPRVPYIYSLRRQTSPKPYAAGLGDSRCPTAGVGRN